MTELRRNDAWAFVFFTLKDPASGACLRATMPRRRFDALELALSDGERVLVEGKAEIYAARARSASAPPRSSASGLATTSPRSSASSATLAAEGLFAAERKRRLPRFPRAVGVVTGADAAARGDVVTGIRSRYPAAHIVITETRVQGAAAGPRDRRRAAARRSAPSGRRRHRRPRRRELRRPPARSATRSSSARSQPAPSRVVSAVGHEQDTPLCDLAADVRASTPTAAARLVVPDLAELRLGLGRLRDRLDASVRRSLARDRERLDRDRERLRAAPRLLLERRRMALDHAAARLQALSPRATLARGYAIVRSGGAALREATVTAAGDRLEIELAAGALTATVVEVRE